MLHFSGVSEGKSWSTGSIFTTVTTLGTLVDADIVSVTVVRVVEICLSVIASVSAAAKEHQLKHFLTCINDMYTPSISSTPSCSALSRRWAF